MIDFSKMHRTRSGRVQPFTPQKIGMSRDDMLKHTDPKEYYRRQIHRMTGKYSPRITDTEHPMNKKVIRPFGVVKGSFSGGKLNFDRLRHYMLL